MHTVCGNLSAQYRRQQARDEKYAIKAIERKKKCRDNTSKLEDDVAVSA